MYSHDGLVNQRSKVLFCLIPVFIVSYIIVHSGENQDNFSKSMYISLFQFFLSDGNLYCSLAVSSLIVLPAKQNVKQQDRGKLLLVKSSWNVYGKNQIFWKFSRKFEFEEQEDLRGFFFLFFFPNLGETVLWHRRLFHICSANAVIFQRCSYLGQD